LLPNKDDATMAAAMDGALLFTPTVAQVDLHSPELKGYIAIAMGILGLAYLMYRGSAKKRRDPLDDSRGPGFSLAQQRSVERQMQGLLVEMAEMARQITAQLDTRAAKLEALIQEADAKLEALRRAGAPTPGEPSFHAAASAADHPQMRHDPMAEQIRALADAGKSIPQIARELNWPAGEVELILALREPGASAVA
jgi:hypothetical protein